MIRPGQQADDRRCLSRMAPVAGFINRGSAAFIGRRSFTPERTAESAGPSYSKHADQALGYLSCPSRSSYRRRAKCREPDGRGLTGWRIMPVMIAAGALGVIAMPWARVDFTSIDVHYGAGHRRDMVFTAGIFAVVWGSCGNNAPARASLWATPDHWPLAALGGHSRSPTKHELVLAHCPCWSVSWSKPCR